MQMNTLNNLLLPDTPPWTHQRRLDAPPKGAVRWSGAVCCDNEQISTIFTTYGGKGLFYLCVEKEIDKT